jgi:hypothetical protein
VHGGRRRDHPVPRGDNRRRSQISIGAPLPNVDLAD